MQRTLGLIVARGQSERVPGKNMRMLGGKPLIAHTFEAARFAESLDRVVLSTDSPEIAGLARRHGIEVPFLRPAALADARSHVIDTALHALAWLADRETYVADYIMLLQPTSPFRTAADIDSAVRMAERADGAAPAVVGVTLADSHPFLMREIDTQGRLRSLPGAGTWRQDLPPVYAVNGAIYLVRLPCLLQERCWCPERSLAYVMPPERSIDIDTEFDLELAEQLLQTRIAYPQALAV